MSGHTYIHTHIHTHIHTYTHTYTHDNYSNPRCAHAHRGLIIKANTASLLAQYNYGQYCTQSPYVCVMNVVYVITT